MNFKDYLKTIKKKDEKVISETTQKKYYDAIEKTFESKHGIIPSSMELLKLKRLLEEVKKEEYDIKGNRMYSVALNHYIKYKELQENIEIEDEKETNDVENTFVSGVEGKARLSYVVTYERDPKLREEAIRIHGCSCAACGFDFNETYGIAGKGYIHIHHIVPVSEFEEPKEINPQTDLIPLCANCHSIVHRKKKSTLKIEELKAILVEQGSIKK
jgi:predicted HNH restriction endonuclease